MEQGPQGLDPGIRPQWEETVGRQARLGEQLHQGRGRIVWVGRSLWLRQHWVFRPKLPPF